MLLREYVVKSVVYISLGWSFLFFPGLMLVSCQRGLYHLYQLCQLYHLCHLYRCVLGGYQILIKDRRLIKVGIKSSLGSVHSDRPSGADHRTPGQAQDLPLLRSIVGAGLALPWVGSATATLGPLL